MDVNRIAGNLRMSLPSRERGLKCEESLSAKLATASLPSRERGLKFNFGIEIGSVSGVAPLAGARIEISVISTEKSTVLSLPSRERGLK